MNWPIELVSDQRGDYLPVAIDLRAAEFVRVLALHLDKGNRPGRGLREVYLDDVANNEDCENKEVIGTLLCRLDFTIVAIVKVEVKGRWKWMRKLEVLVMYGADACVLLHANMISYS